LCPHPPASMQRRHERKGYSWFGSWIVHAGGISQLLIAAQKNPLK